jgi:hypothetical protein
MMASGMGNLLLVSIAGICDQSQEKKAADAAGGLFAS